VDPDRYDGLTALGRILGLDQSREDTLWRDEALVILNQAVLESFSKAGVTMIDHHTATADFMKFCDREKRSGRAVQADWSWMIPPLSPAATPVWNADWPNQEQDPRLLQNPPSASH
jgi:nitric-oxide synthase